MITLQPEAWTLQAKCVGMGDALFPEAPAQKRVKMMCVDCPVRLECLAEALDNEIEWGIWGGTTERERRSMLRRHPGVSSWRSLLLDTRQSA